MRLIDADELQSEYKKYHNGKRSVLIDVATTIELPERKIGRWLRYGEDGYPNNEDTVFWQCDQCLERYTWRTKRIVNFCPNCGSYNGGESDET